LCYNNIMRRHRAILVVVLVFAACSSPTTDIDPAYRTEIEAVWAEREAKLTAEDGWLSLTGLYWLEPGSSAFGSNNENPVWIPDGAAIAGALVLGGDGAVTLKPSPEAGLTVNGQPATERILASDAAGAPDVVRSGRALFYLISRGDRIGVRVKDPESPSRREFHGLQRFPIDPAFRVTAALEPYDEPQEVAIPTVLGEPTTMLAPGLLRFELGGEALTLEPYVSSPDDTALFIVFRDATSGDTTYGAGRFLSAELESTGVVLDFNLAVNPPCAFTPYATCPLPTPENTLFVAIEAGEKAGQTAH